ncbi:MAG: hypothetical protein OQK46_03475 [Gammaproteobacteria bacterium]|nr:hypothetical protein [Gammaproteobacteria bacterium]
MKNIYALSGMVFYLGSILDSRIHEYIFVLWLVAFILIWYGWSLLFSFILLVTTSSYEFMSIESSNYFTSSVLPWVFGISASVSLIFFMIKYRLFNNTSVGADSSGSFGGDSGGGGGGDC